MAICYFINQTLCTSSKAAFLPIVRIAHRFMMAFSTGVLLLALVLAFGFTGYLLPWDQKAYWATKVGTSMLRTVPFAMTGMVSAVLAIVLLTIIGLAS